MNGYLKQSTASQSRLIGPFIDDTDFKTAETGLTIANTDIKLRANGTTLSNKNSGGGTHQVNGMYSVTWDATDTANVGELYGSVVVAGALPVFFSYVVLEEAVYDALFGTSAVGYASQASVDVIDDFLDTEIAAILAAVDTEVAAILSDTNAILVDTAEIGAAGAGLTNINLPNQTMDIVGNITGNLSGSVGSVTGSVGSVTANVDANLVEIFGDAGGVDALDRSTRTMVMGTVDAGASTTNIPTSSLSPAASVIDQFKGRIVIFDEDTTTANLRGQATDITSNTAMGALTVTALTTAPASGDTFIIV